MIAFTVWGIAQPAGSKRAMPIYRNGPNGRQIATRENGSPIIAVIDDNPKSKSWKQEIAHAAAEAMKDKLLLSGPVRLQVVFTMPRPQGHYGSGKNAGSLKPKAPRFHVVKPDVTKLVRGIEDALKGIVWRDDSQVAETTQTKIYGEQARVDVIVKELKEDFELAPPRWGSVVTNGVV